MSCITHWKPVPAHVDRGSALRYAWLRAPPLVPARNLQPSRSRCLTQTPHMRVGKGAHCSACPRGQNRARAVPTRPISRNRFCPPSYGATRQALTARVWVVPGGAAAARGAMRSAARGRRGRCAQGLASGNCCNSQHHLISGRTTRSVAHIPHACGEEATRMRPIYDDGYCLAQGWHGHHPSRADRVAMRRGAPVVSRYTC